MKISAPMLSPQLEEATTTDLVSDDLEDARLYDVDATNCAVTAMNIASALFEKVLLTSAQMERISARDMWAKRSDFSAANLSNGAINRAKFDNCRMSGVDFNKTSLHDIVFSNCKLDMANFRFTHLRRVTFIDCTLLETDFLGATLHDVTFESCILEKTIFDQVKCKHVDMRSSQLNELSGWSSLSGATIDSVQLTIVAPYLAQQMGITIRND